MNCPKCGFQNQEGSNHCQKCSNIFGSSNSNESNHSNQNDESKAQTMPQEYQSLNPSHEESKNHKNKSFKKIILILLGILIIGGTAFVGYYYKKNSLPLITKIIFEEDNISDKPFEDFLLKVDTLAKEWASDAQLKRITAWTNNSVYAYSFEYISQSETTETSKSEKDNLTIIYNAEYRIYKDNLFKVKYHDFGNQSEFKINNNKLFGLYCYDKEATFCKQMPFSKSDNININEIEISSKDAIEIFTKEKKDNNINMAILVNDNINPYWRIKMSKIDAKTGKITDVQAEEKESDLIDPGDVDSDGDGLFDAEEEIYKTNPKNPDTDGDGYLDGDEIENGYNPLGEGKLE